MSVSIRASRRTREIIATIPRHMMRHKRALRKSLHDIADIVLTETTHLIKSPPKTGRWRTKALDPSVPHQASAPGEAPANDTGRLAASGDYKVKNEYEMTIGETMEYAKFLEHGTRKMEPRPHLIKAVENKSQDSENIILANVDREINNP